MAVCFCSNADEGKNNSIGLERASGGENKATQASGSDGGAIRKTGGGGVQLGVVCPIR